ncbi:iron-sulfur cluster assembly scaffold protein [Rhodobacter veldkampii DSM 11550]|uniref:Iron-sulfur cluster assembly scaffold protein n=1 Tax=Phaeovulum veldkampii DSM 11550 TaxID=1185920 RepID=A0A2T4JM46_9RHOB|nr:iron-sulfur cluster assembly scaffold protein [Phaeovulum veldkampii]MBK5945923.1 iron-sulfur cluster assembly scaffold protein [Phaeovulum veldkampii DSM 11550]PTE18952.1 iron-sulfur cluster assembly scaffold protein [Phaeovulum veldkampii DSM 11550]TDQ64683.1 modular FeS cluster scaffolding protein NifU [Phaeovulum veldkampii DSM 11550]
MSETDLIKLYSRRILALAADIPLAGHLAAPQASAMARAPLCGSTVAVDLTLAEGRIVEFAQDVRACALGQASAALLGGVVIGRSRAEVARARDQLAAMLSGGPVPDAPFEGFEVLRAACDVPNRHASILLALRATCAAFDQIGD